MTKADVQCRVVRTTSYHAIFPIHSGIIKIIGEAFMAYIFIEKIMQLWVAKICPYEQHFFIKAGICHGQVVGQQGLSLALDRRGYHDHLGLALVLFREQIVYIGT